MARATSQNVVVAGGGIVGMMFALRASQRAGSAINVAICDPSLHVPRKVGRASTITAGPRQALIEAGVWQDLAAQAEPIAAMHISDSKRRDAVRPVYLRFDGEVAESQPFAHVIEDRVLLEALEHHCQRAGIINHANGAARTKNEAGRRSVVLSDGQTLGASLLVAADGARSPLRRMIGIGVSGWSYPQTGLVATLSLERGHEGIAIQHFLEGGPLALLPLPSNRASIVWTLPKAEAKRLLSLTEDEFIQELEDCLGYQFGTLKLTQPVQGLALYMQIARSFIGDRVALIGDAAHVIHPLAGQGLNLGLGDAIALADVVAQQANLGLDVGSASGLQQYQRARRFEAVTMAAATDGLNRLFANDFTPLRLLRDLGLGLVDRMPAIKQRLIERAAALPKVVR